MSGLRARNCVACGQVCGTADECIPMILCSHAIHMACIIVSNRNGVLPCPACRLPSLILPATMFLVVSSAHQLALSAPVVRAGKGDSRSDLLYVDQDTERNVLVIGGSQLTASHHLLKSAGARWDRNRLEAPMSAESELARKIQSTLSYYTMIMPSRLECPISAISGTTSKPRLAQDVPSTKPEFKGTLKQVVVSFLKWVASLDPAQRSKRLCIDVGHVHVSLSTSAHQVAPWDKSPVNGKCTLVVHRPEELHPGTDPSVVDPLYRLADIISEVKASLDKCWSRVKYSAVPPANWKALSDRNDVILETRSANAAISTDRVVWQPIWATDKTPAAVDPAVGKLIAVDHAF